MKRRTFMKSTAAAGIPLVLTAPEADADATTTNSRCPTRPDRPDARESVNASVPCAVVVARATEFRFQAAVVKASPGDAP